MLSSLNRIPVAEHFSLHEFACSCCRTVCLDPVLLARLVKLRIRIGRPISIHSGYRCPRHNQDVDGAGNSYHMKGMAADIAVQGMTPRELKILAEEIGFGGIGLYTTFLHVDTGPNRRW